MVVVKVEVEKGQKGPSCRKKVVRKCTRVRGASQQHHFPARARAARRDAYFVRRFGEDVVLEAFSHWLKHHILSKILKMPMLQRFQTRPAHLSLDQTFKPIHTGGNGCPRPTMPLSRWGRSISGHEHEEARRGAGRARARHEQDIAPRQEAPCPRAEARGNLPQAAEHGHGRRRRQWRRRRRRR